VEFVHMLREDNQIVDLLMQSFLVELGPPFDMMVALLADKMKVPFLRH